MVFLISYLLFKYLFILSNKPQSKKSTVFKICENKLSILKLLDCFTCKQLKTAHFVTALFVEQCRNSKVIMIEQCCSTLLFPINCFNNVVQHCWNGCFKLLEQKKTILLEQTARYSFHCCSTLLKTCNSIDGQTML